MKIKAFFAVALGGLVYALGGWDRIMQILCYLVLLDYLSGVISAIYHKKLSSNIGAKGIAKKIGMFLIISLAVAVDRFIGGTVPLREITTAFYIANEGISVLENLGEFTPFPAFLKQMLETIKKKAKEGKNELH